MKNKKSLISSEIKGSENKIFNVTLDVFKTIFLIFTCLLFLDRNFQKIAMRISNANISIVKNDFRNLTGKEVNFMCLIAGLFIGSKLVIQIVTKESVSKFFAMKVSLIDIVIYLLVLPITIFLAYILLEYFGIKIIVACYLAYIIKILPDVLINDDVNKDKMEKVDIN